MFLHGLVRPDACGPHDQTEVHVPHNPCLHIRVPLHVGHMWSKQGQDPNREDSNKDQVSTQQFQNDVAMVKKYCDIIRKH